MNNSTLKNAVALLREFAKLTATTLDDKLCDALDFLASNPQIFQWLLDLIAAVKAGVGLTSLEIPDHVKAAAKAANVSEDQLRAALPVAISFAPAVAKYAVH